MEKWCRAIALSLAIVSGGATAATAKDICVQDNFGDHWVFKKVKGLKPGKVTPLHGIYSPATLKVPVAGTAFMTSTTAVHIGVFVHSMAPFSGVNISVTQIADAAFTGSGQYENSGDNAADGPMSWTAVNCATVPSP